MTIPKIVHQLWIGPKHAPTNLMQSWKDKHPDFEYILWTELEIEKRNMQFQCSKQIADIQEINGKADIMRWEILYKYGGIFVDADSICIEPFDEIFTSKTAFATYENENVRKDLVATGTMGFVPNHPLCRDIIDWILSDESEPIIQNFRAWYSVGPALLTKFLNTGKYKNFSVFPSHCFLPIHFTGPTYEGHKKVYGYQVWGTANQSYDTMNSVILPDEFTTPQEWVSVLVSSYNTSELFLKECLDSIKMQTGYFGIELVWINDGSTKEYTDILELALADWTKKTRFTKLVYKKTDENMGTYQCLHQGVLLCSNEFIFKMDSDDIMLPNRIKTQLAFMKKTPDCHVCGTNIQFFINDSMADPRSKMFQMDKKHAFEFTWSEFLKMRTEWFLNHPTLCFRKSSILTVGNYNNNINKNIHKCMMEDYDLELRLLKTYNKVYSLPEVLLYHRIHSKQLTYNNASENPQNIALRKQIIENVIHSFFV